MPPVLYTWSTQYPVVTVGDKDIVSDVSPVFHKNVALPKKGDDVAVTVVLSPSQIMVSAIVIVGSGAKY